MDLISILAAVILFTTVGTLFVAIAAYAAYKLRDHRKPNPHAKAPRIPTDKLEPIFLTPYLPEKHSDH